MELLVFGHEGVCVLSFPTSMGRFFDWEDRGMIAVVGEQLEHGTLQLFCVDSVDTESWYAKGIAPADRARRHVAYDRYLRTEVHPFVTGRNPNPLLITAGVSLGAYHAVNLALRYPDVVHRAIGMSGYYDVRRWTDGYTDDNVYYNNPMEFIPNEHEPHRLEALRRLDIVLVTGSDDSGRPNNETLAGALAAKEIPHALRVWDGWAHDWPIWQEMLKKYIAGKD